MFTKNSQDMLPMKPNGAEHDLGYFVWKGNENIWTTLVGYTLKLSQNENWRNALLPCSLSEQFWFIIMLLVVRWCTETKETVVGYVQVTNSITTALAKDPSNSQLASPRLHHAWSSYGLLIRLYADSVVRSGFASVSYKLHSTDHFADCEESQKLGSNNTCSHHLCRVKVTNPLKNALGVCLVGWFWKQAARVSCALDESLEVWLERRNRTKTPIRALDQNYSRMYHLRWAHLLALENQLGEL